MNIEEASNMLSVISLVCKTDNQDQGYRKFYLEGDIQRAKLAMLFFIVPMVGFAYNDFNFFGFSNIFYFLIGIRCIVVAEIVLAIHYVGKMVSPKKYDSVLFFNTLVLLVGGGVINSFRPQDFIVQAVITIISVFVVFLFVPFRFLYQCILSFAASAGEALIILLIIQPTQSPALFTILFGLLISNVIAAIGAYQFQLYRKKLFSEFLKNKEMQQKLEEHTKHLENLVVERTEKLRNAERFAAIGATASMVGHDLRNPLTGISNAVYILKRKNGKQLDQTGEQMISIIENNVDYSNKIINDLLDYSGKINLEQLRKVTPRMLVDSSLAMINIPQNVSVAKSVEDMPELSIDEVKLKRVCINIIKNALDSMPQGGHLTIKSRVADNTVYLSFNDTGEGISAEAQKNLFQPLYTTKAKGMGFGLAICQRIAEAHGGKITVQSIPKLGSTFTIELPLKQVAKERF